MGIKCPICHKHGAYVLAITASGESAIKASDIIARKLSCGHTVGSVEYMQYREQLKVVESNLANKIRGLHEQAQMEKENIWQAIRKSVAEE